MAPGAHGPSEGSLIRRGEEEKKQDEKEEEEEAIENVDSDTDGSLWEEKTKTNVREM